MQIREATPEDFDEIWPIFHEVSSAGETYAYPRETSRQEAERLWMDFFCQTYVVEIDGQVVGTYYIKTNQAGPGSHVCNCGYMVATAARGKGIATALCEHSQNIAVQLGYKDKKRLEAHLAARDQVRDKQRGERAELQRAQELKSLDVFRMRDLAKVEKREQKSLEESLLREARTMARGGRNQMPSLSLDLSPPGRKAKPHKAARNRFERALSGEQEPKEIDLPGDFERAANDGRSEAGGKGSGEGKKPRWEINAKPRRYGRNSRGKDKENDLDQGR